MSGRQDVFVPRLRQVLTIIIAAGVAALTLFVLHSCDEYRGWPSDGQGYAVR